MAYATLRQMYVKYDLLPKIVDPITDAAYEFVAQKAWTENRGNSPHGKPWHTSFHASRFPTSVEFACPRKAVYELADFAQTEPANRKLVGQGEAGKAIEVSLTERWHEYGVLLSPPPTEPIQLGAQDKDSWLTCSFDSVILPPGWNRPLPVEVKSKALDKVREMIVGQKGPDDNHVAQLRVQMYFLHKNQSEWWPDLEPVEQGVIYYVARDDPSVTKEFALPLDIGWVEERIDVLKTFQDRFRAGEIAQTQQKSHPLGWKWSEQPCKWCPFKRDTCKPDWKEDITDLSNSNGITRTNEIRNGEYDYGEAKEKVLNRWSD